MASALEVQVEQKKRLFMLLSIKEENKEYPLKGIDKKIAETIAEMQQEDVAWVEKAISNFYTNN